jgi:fumarylacetoacetate (FAA) hydrolase
MYPPSIRVFPWLGPTDFSFGNTASILGPEDEIPAPEGSAGLDYGLALAAMIGAGGAIGGFTLANTWTARGIEAIKSRDFATSIGPLLVTPDEFSGDARAMVARVNGEERSRIDLATLAHPWPELTAHAARNTRLRPGDLLIVDAGPGVHELGPGDVCEIEAEGIGILRNRVA